MTKSAENPGGGGGMAAGIGMGMGMAMADRMARRGPWGERPRPPRPRRRRRRPAARSAGTSRRTARRSGPSPATSSGAWPAEGTIGPDTWLWTPGGPDWQRGRDVGELADLFSAPPPPPPAG